MMRRTGPETGSELIHWIPEVMNITLKDVAGQIQVCKIEIAPSVKTLIDRLKEN